MKGSSHLLFWFIFLCAGTLAAQLSVDNSPEGLLPIPAPSNFEVSTNKDLPSLQEALLGHSVVIAPQAGQQQHLMYRPHLAFFCRVEVKIDQAVGLPFRFRLGSVDYVDYLEGKRSYP